MKTKVFVVALILIVTSFSAVQAGKEESILENGFDSLIGIQADGGIIIGSYEFVESYDGNALMLPANSYVLFEDVPIPEVGSIEIVIWPLFDVERLPTGWDYGLGGSSEFLRPNSLGFWVYKRNDGAFVIFELKNSMGDYSQAWSDATSLSPLQPHVISFAWKCNQKKDKKSTGQTMVDGEKGWKISNFCQDIELGFKDLEIGFNNFYGGGAFIIESIKITDRAKLKKKTWKKIKKLSNN